MMNKKNLCYALLAVIFISGFFLRVYPVTQFDKPLKYDSYYHIRVAELIQEKGALPTYEPWPYGGRPHIYPPLYHLSVVALNLATGLSITDVVRFFLPIISALTILAVFWLVRKFSTENAALLASLFTSLNPYLISSSYDSPQVIGLFLSCFAVYLLLKGKDIWAGLLLGVIFLFNTFSAMSIAAPMVLYLLFTKQPRRIPAIVAFPALFSALWYLPKLDVMACYDNFIGSYFIGKAMGNFMLQEAVIAVSSLLIAFALLGRIKTKLHAFYIVWVLFFLAMLLSFVVTTSFHPWRQSTFISFGFSIFLALILDDLKGWKKFLFSSIFIALFLLGITYLAVMVQSFSPPLKDQEYTMLSWIDANLPSNAVILAQHDICANLLTLTSKMCVLDISFECIQNKTSFYDYENFFWAKNGAEAQGILSKYPVTHVLYGVMQYKDTTVDETDVDRVYTSWACTMEECEKGAAVYEVS